MNRRWNRALAALVGVVVGFVSAHRGRAEMTAFPLPEIIVDPNEGTTGGVLGILLVSDEHKRIRHIIAPDVRYNGIFGVYPTLRYFGYPTATQQFFLSGGKSTKIDEYFEGNYRGTDLFGGRLDFSAMAQRDLDSRERFFGIGNNTPESQESNYTGNVVRGQAEVSLHLPDDLRASAGTRFRWVRVRHGGVDNLPYTGDVFSSSEARGIDGELIVGQSFGLWYDTRDLPDAPVEGSRVGASFEVVDKALGSSVSFLRYWIDARTFKPLRRDRRVVLALHGFAQYLQDAKDAPFYELSSLGGMTSLRGFGSHRFRDNHRIGVQTEVRCEVYRREVFGVLAALEVSPFFDAAKVFADSGDLPFRDLHGVGGVGFRVVVRPQVVAYVDVGYGRDGVATFTGIDYPF